VILSILIGGLVYVLVQIAFIGALDPALLAKAGTWTNIATPGHSAALKELNAAPFYQVASLAGLAWLAAILRLDAIISPGGTGLIYLTSASRISFGLSRNGYIPQAFERNSQRTKVPVFGVIVTPCIGLLFLLPFPSWEKLVGVVTSASVMMYAGAPLSLGALRRQKPDLPRPYRLRGAQFFAPMSFVLANFVVYFAGWSVYSTLMVVVLIGIVLIGLSYTLHLNPNRPEIDWGAAVWVVPYLVGMGVISYLGQFPVPSAGIIGGVGSFKTVLVGGTGTLSLGVDLIVVAVFSLAIYYLAISRRLPPEKVDHYVREVYPPRRSPSRHRASGGRGQHGPAARSASPSAKRPSGVSSVSPSSACRGARTRSARATARPRSWLTTIAGRCSSPRSSPSAATMPSRARTRARRAQRSAPGRAGADLKRRPQIIQAAPGLKLGLADRRPPLLPTWE